MKEYFKDFFKRPVPGWSIAIFILVIAGTFFFIRTSNQNDLNNVFEKQITMEKQTRTDVQNAFIGDTSITEAQKTTIADMAVDRLYESAEYRQLRDQEKDLTGKDKFYIPIVIFLLGIAGYCIIPLMAGFMQHLYTKINWVAILEGGPPTIRAEDAGIKISATEKAEIIKLHRAFVVCASILYSVIIAVLSVFVL